MADRYFVESPIAAERALLCGAEAHHLAHVMRARPQDEVVLFDGSGAEFLARVERVGRAEVELTIVSRELIDREARTRVTLGVALPKGERQRWLVEKAVELGVARLVPLATERSNEPPSAAGLSRLRRAVIEASKQCGRNRLMEIQSPEPLDDFLAGVESDAWRWIAHPGAKAGGEASREFRSASADGRPVAVAIGPEGGFSDAEVAKAVAAGWCSVSLGARILRVETAAMALAAAAIYLPG